MTRLLRSRAGRDPLGSDRLFSGSYRHHYRQFRGGMIADFVMAIRERTGVSVIDTTVIGYSQAAPLTVAVSALRPAVAAIVVLGLGALPPGQTTLGSGRADRAFVGVGSKDPFVDPDSLAELTAAWGSVTGGLTVRHYDIPHVMSPAMTNDVSHWIRAR